MLRSRLWILIISLCLLASVGCDGGGSRKGVIGPQNLQFKTVYAAPATQTIEAIHDAISIGTSTCTVFSYTEGGVRKLAWLVEVAPGSGSGGGGLIPGSFTYDDDFAIQIKLLGARWVLIAIRSADALQVGYLTIFPSTIPQFELSAFSTVATGDIGTFYLRAHPDLTTAWLGWTEREGAASRLRTARLDSIASGTLNITPEFNSGAITPGTTDLTLDSSSVWDGMLLGGYIDRDTNAAAWVLGQRNTLSGDPLATAVAVQWNGTKLAAPLTTSGLFAAPRPTEAQFAAPPTVEPCPGADGFTYADTWITTLRDSARVALVAVGERKYNCPEDPAQLLFDGTTWVLGALGGKIRRFADQAPLLLVEGGDKQRVFLAHPGFEGIDVLRASNLTRLAVIDFDPNRVPAGLVVDFLHATGREEFDQLRVLGHTAGGIFIAERSVGNLVAE